MWCQGGYEHGIKFPLPDGKRCGQGKRTWVSNNTYKGDWLDDKVTGNSNMAALIQIVWIYSKKLASMHIHDLQRCLKYRCNNT